MYANPFSDQELEARLTRVRAKMAERDLDLALFSTPENIFYLTGLDHWGYFAPHLLIVPAEGDMTLVTRAMERVTIEHQVRNALFEGHSDSETAADMAVRHLRARSTAKTRQQQALVETEQVIDALPGVSRRIGVETWSSGHSYGFGAALRDNVEHAEWTDITGLADELRLVKSPEEQEIMRRAAAASDAGTAAAIAAIHDGAAEADVAAECIAAMTRAGGTPPGFGPFIRPEARMAEEHTSWGDGVYRKGERVFLEVAGCVARYNAPQGRLVNIGSIPDEDAEMAEISKDALDAILTGLKPGVRARDVYDAWQKVVDEAGMPHYRRHHCGYLVGIGFPPSWTGGNKVTGLRHDSDLEILEGMTFHAMSWFTETGRGNFFVSNTVLLGPNGAEVLTKTPAGPTVV
ncbi:Xaa-Pro dipeptidase [Rhodobium orientis]|uniref:Creatininase n=1 Tax=Rhodobium orientis TaxID=34017 RepID=A0A327JKX7_9HYPH|nr:Xaa-Pro peptidase family protein [Rhodobium orientis]MBB4305431.1 Xaa-Pro dipeptidase [Rhodobium orientis]MBK5948340.1 creatininase [Rhodobium orientis]RAI25492.1 creatininase [Rhodobium orientis]